MTDLKPCPFCGGEATLGNEYDGQSFINCSDCLASTNLLITNYKNTEEEARQLWNRRIKDAPTHSEFCKIPLEEGERVTNMFSSNHHIAVITNKGGIFLIGQDGIARRVIRSEENE